MEYHGTYIFIFLLLSGSIDLYLIVSRLMLFRRNKLVSPSAKAYMFSEAQRGEAVLGHPCAVRIRLSAYYDASSTA